MIQQEIFEAISTVDGYLHFVSGSGADLSTHIASINIPANLTDFSAITEAGASVSGTANTISVGPISGNAGLTVFEESSFNDQFLYGNMEIVFDGIVTGRASGGYNVIGTLESPNPEVYDGNLSWLDGLDNNRGIVAEFLTAYLLAQSGGNAQNFNINIEGELLYYVEVDENGAIDQQNSHVGTIINGQSLVLTLDQISYGTSFAEAYLISEWQANTPGASGELTEWVIHQTNGAPEFYQGAFGQNGNDCFPAGTLIHLWGGTIKPIEQITQSDIVLTHDATGRAVPGVVDKLFTNTTQAFVRLMFEDGREPLVSTPGHRFLTETGDYMEIGHMLRLGGGTVRLTDTDCSIVEATGEVIAYSAETAEMFEQAQTKTIAFQGNTVFKEQVEAGWQTYNFEVRTHHNYVADCMRLTA